MHADAAVHAHYFFVDQVHQRHVVERVVEGLPEADLVSSLDLVEETVDSGDGLALVVATQDDDLSWEAHL